MRITSMALVAALIVGVTAPAFASDTNLDGSSFEEFSVVSALRAKGIDAVAANDNWNGKIRVTVIDENGQQKFAYFYEDTLQPVKAPVTANTRVLSKVDTGVKANTPAAHQGSLLEDHFFDEEDDYLR